MATPRASRNNATLWRLAILWPVLLKKPRVVMHGAKHTYRLPSNPTDNSATAGVKRLARGVVPRPPGLGGVPDPRPGSLKSSGGNPARVLGRLVARGAAGQVQAAVRVEDVRLARVEDQLHAFAHLHRHVGFELADDAVRAR